MRASCCSYSSVLVAVEARSTSDHCARALCFAICAAQRGSWKPSQLAQKLDLSRVFGLRALRLTAKKQLTFVRRAIENFTALQPGAMQTFGFHPGAEVSPMRRRLPWASTVGVSSAVRCPPSSCCPPVWTRSLIAAKRSPRLFKVLPGRPANMGECGNECLSRRDVTCGKFFPARQTRAAASTAADLNFASSATRWRLGFARGLPCLAALRPRDARWPPTSHLWEQARPGSLSS